MLHVNPGTFVRWLGIEKDFFPGTSEFEQQPIRCRRVKVPDYIAQATGGYRLQIVLKVNGEMVHQVL